MNNFCFRSVDQVDDTMAEIQEQMDVAAEISVAISQPLGNDGLAGFLKNCCCMNIHCNWLFFCLIDDDLEAELEALEQDDLNEKLSAIESTAGLASPAKSTKEATAAASPAIKSPSVPQSDPHDEAAQLAALEAEMAVWYIQFRFSCHIATFKKTNSKNCKEKPTLTTTKLYFFLLFRVLFPQVWCKTQYSIEITSI